GWVLNDSDGVLARVCGPAHEVEQFEHALHHQAPAASRVASIDRVIFDDEEAEPLADEFTIRDSLALDAPRRAAIPADLKLCDACRDELLDPRNRRHGYPFINCTQCGPRYSIVE